jgi:hypothetical protein
MAKTKRRGFDFDFGPLVETVGLKKVLDVFRDEQIVEQMGPERLAKLLENERFLSQLSAEARKRLIKALGGVPNP